MPPWFRLSLYKGGKPALDEVHAPPRETKPATSSLPGCASSGEVELVRPNPESGVERTFRGVAPAPAVARGGWCVAAVSRSLSDSLSEQMAEWLARNPPASHHGQ